MEYEKEVQLNLIEVTDYRISIVIKYASRNPDISPPGISALVISY